MKNTLICLLISVAIVVGCSNQDSELAEQKKLTQKFLACVPDSLDEDRREEIAALFELFWKRVERDLVFPEDAGEITTKLRQYVDAGRIIPSDLLYFMAQVGYYTYRQDPRYNLPEGIPDHPTINPNAALIRLVPDSTGTFQGYYLPPRAPDDSTKKPSDEGPEKD